VIDPVSGSKRRHDAACATREGHITHEAIARPLDAALAIIGFAIPALG
jgi:hypothetical protein